MSAALPNAAGVTNPWLLGAQIGLGGVNVLSGLFRKKKAALHLDPFTFNPDPNDPEIALRRRAALLDQSRTHANTVNEIGRAGLLGSSAAFGLLNQGDIQSNAALEDIPNSVYARQRSDALSLYRDNANFQRQKYLADDGYSQQEHMAGLDSLGDLGTNIGYGLDAFSRRKKALLGTSPSLYSMGLEDY